MTFKEKHLLPLVIAATLTASCSDEKKIFSKDKEPEVNGLLDERPLKDNDKYNVEVTLYQVDIPVYQKNGERLEGQYMLTRGLKSSSYESSQSLDEMSVKPVFINGSKEACYVKVDDNNAIYTERGFCGLFVDYNKKAVIVSDANVTQFISELNVKSITSSLRSEIRRNNRNNAGFIDVEAIKSDSLNINNVERNDSLVVDTAKTDSVGSKKMFSDKQFLDTLNNMRQKDVY